MSQNSNSVIHYTNPLTNLLGIFRENFKLKYCQENILGASPAIPMISFCDLPLSEVKHHIKYGKYGIGLKKEWARKMGLNPVLYLEAESYVGKTLRQYGNKLNNIPTSHDRDYTRIYVSLISFIKNVEGNNKKGGDNYSYYNEREWRYVPTFEGLKTNPIKDGADEFPANAILSELNYKYGKDRVNKWISQLRLKFTYSDISYIIVEHDEDIKELVATLKNVYSTLNEEQFELLLTKVLTWDQIERDF